MAKATKPPGSCEMRNEHMNNANAANITGIAFAPVKRGDSIYTDRSEAPATDRASSKDAPPIRGRGMHAAHMIAQWGSDTRRVLKSLTAACASTIAMRNAAIISGLMAYRLHQMVLNDFPTAFR